MKEEREEGKHEQEDEDVGQGSRVEGEMQEHSPAECEPRDEAMLLVTARMADPAAERQDHDERPEGR